MNVEEIIRKVKAEAAERFETSETEAVKPAEISVVKRSYSYSELAVKSGSEFISDAYRCLLHREPDPGAQNFLDALNSGQLSKAEIINIIVNSPEGREKQAQVSGLENELLKQKIKKLPFIGYFIRLCISIIKLPRFINHVSSIDAKYQKEIEKLITSINSVQAYAGTKACVDDIRSVSYDKQQISALLSVKADAARIQELRADIDLILQQLDKKADKAETADKINTAVFGIKYADKYIQSITTELNRLITSNTLREKVTEADTGGLQSVISDKLYIDFEEKFRGSEADVIAKVKAYLPLINGISLDLKKESALDIGCGRGEFLKLLSDAFGTAKGMDLNGISVEICRDKGLDAVKCDGIAHLQSLESESAAMISSLHVVEHLPNEVLLTLLSEAYRVLKKGGILILETPNPRNILVGSGDFYRDFTHIKPVFPDTLAFLVKYQGFDKADICYFESDGEEHRLVSSAHQKFDDINDYMNISRDYTVIGYKI